MLWCHIKCENISEETYKALVQSGDEFSFICMQCILNQLPNVELHNDNVTDAKPGSQQNFEGIPDDQFDCFKRKGLHFLHINCRSLISKLDQLKLLAQKTKAAIICVSETWLDSSVTDTEINTPGYLVTCRDRNREGGGVCIYVREDLAFNPRNDLNDSELESVWIELCLPKTKPILIGCAYRPPKKTNFFDILENNISNCHRFSDIECYLFGDFNINLLRNSKYFLPQVISNFCRLFDLQQIVRDVTRLCSSSLLDHIFVSDPEKVAQSGVIDYGISDHSVTYCTRKIVKGLIKKHNTVKIRSLKNYNIRDFVNKLNDTDWSSVYSSISVDEAVENFVKIFQEILDLFAPVVSVRLKQRSEPWFNNEILSLIKERDHFLYKFRKCKNRAFYVSYCQCRNKVQRLVRAAKKEFFETQLEENKNDSKKLWKNLKMIGYSKNSRTRIKIGLNVDDEICFDEQTVANKFNVFYTTVASNLVKLLPRPFNIFNTDFVTNYYASKGIINDSFALHTVDREHVLTLLKNINKTKGIGVDNLPARFLCDGAEPICDVVLFVVNRSISSNTVPNIFKTARVVPIYKKNSKFEEGNYRPVSLTCVLSKLLERVIYIQLDNYLKTNNILYEHQSGFRQGYSTDSCLIHITDFIKHNIGIGNYTGMVLMDLQKAFDTVDHNILCNKLQAIGLNNNSVSWFRSYLCNRQQMVEINGVCSDKLTQSCGVPQGSILGPILFLIYINDMSAAVNCKLSLYADDSALIVSDKDINVVELKLNQELENVKKWFTDNKLSLHLGKTESILFASKRKLKTRNCLNIVCNNIQIKSVDNVKYLGAYLDQSLSGVTMAKNVLKKVNGRLKFLYRQCNNLSSNIKKTLANSLINCHFDYSCSYWFSTLPLDYRKKLQTSQNKIVRFVNNFHNRHHVGPEELENLNWLDVVHRVAQLKMSHVHNIFYNKCPEYLSEHFCKISNSHRYNTRGSSYNFYVPNAKGIQSQSFYYTAINQWNSLPNSVKCLEDKNNFKRSLK